MTFARRLGVTVACFALLGTASACASDTEAAQIILESPWVRTTDGATDKTMTALFVSLTNPGSTNVVLTSADCSSVAGMTQIHEMVMADGKMAMQEAKGGVTIPSEGHMHLQPGGYHVMLMNLKNELAVGTEVTCSLTFDNGQTSSVTGQVKKFTEETDHYHGSASPSPAMNG